MTCETCLHNEICRFNSIPIFGMDNVACQYEAHELVGEWIEHRQFNPIGCFYSEYECSNCHDDVWQKTEWQFCPNCGAKMT